MFILALYFPNTQAFQSFFQHAFVFFATIGHVPKFAI